ncbi:MAG TPA: hypothetical protein VJ987_03280 [Anaerolineales bacterium]|nr:hypothetical protein [Anaerolineales bacterium]
MLKIFRFQMIILFAAVIFYAVFAFASTETGIPSGGEGVNIISGWTVSNIQYRLADGSANVSAVEFDLDGLADVVRVGFGSFDDSYFSCVDSNARHWVCSIYPRVKVSELNELRVVATGN